ncbi:hypothetical protein [Pandoraea sputorum]|uniref:Uncharacterized protein n=1 Tax=Pandoraea sputorum TaxID=93222 RepID=A0A239SLS5_9BURK|nr:hypothetical protein [Pandoraea sputorum]SNU85704.1 Uncharacterised protein [Pandoraea sputorum]VVE39911.1 hypothetical protein PSP20601_04082 [Pandoraea sputorum]
MRIAGAICAIDARKHRDIGDITKPADNPKRRNKPRQYEKLRVFIRNNPNTPRHRRRIEIREYHVIHIRKNPLKLRSNIEREVRGFDSSIGPNKYLMQQCCREVFSNIRRLAAATRPIL